VRQIDSQKKKEKKLEPRPAVPVAPPMYQGPVAPYQGPPPAAAWGGFDSVESVDGQRYVQVTKSAASEMPTRTGVDVSRRGWAAKNVDRKNSRKPNLREITYEC